MALSNDKASGDGTMESEAPGNDVLSSLLRNQVAEQLIRSHVAHLLSPGQDSTPAAFDLRTSSAEEVLPVGLAVFDAFLQANVTGPVLPNASASRVESLFAEAWNLQRGANVSEKTKALHHLRRAALGYLEVDGVAPYAHIPNIELFSLARYIIIEVLSSETREFIQVPSTVSSSARCSISWTSLRLHAWHYKILTEPSLGPGSNFNRSSQWIEVPSLATKILRGTEKLRAKIFGLEVWADQDKEEAWTLEDKARFLVETASNYISLGRHDKASEALKEAVETTGFSYALSGALGKRTKFQENNISQLVVLARSGTNKPESKAGANEEEMDGQEADAKPDALKLNDDTLLEEIHFSKDKENQENGTSTVTKMLPPALADLTPDDQPQLDALDEIILLIEATIKDAFSPSDSLTSEQILPFAVRVITDKSVNWQIYTQALLVRSRIELHRSRTVERGVLQLQAVADQVITDTTYSTSSMAEAQKDENPETGDALPIIRVSASGQEAAPVDRSKPTTFLPAPKPSESAPAQVRLRYIHALSSPPRWHLESELAHGWAGVGSMASALEIFKRLRLWAEVALCLASAAAAAAQDEDGRGSGGEEKAKGIVRWRLFSRTGAAAASSTAEPEDEVIGQDVTLLKAADWSGPERKPPPPEAPRLWCILGDLENDPAHYERAWEISKRRFARAQRSLGEYYIQQKEWEKALAAYKEATRVNRMSPEMWGRLGDINLRLGYFEDAAQAFSRSIGSATDAAGGEGARTWSNLGSALWSLYLERAESQEQQQPEAIVTKAEDEDEDEEPDMRDDAVSKDPSQLLAQALSAYKKGASIAHDNWRIWDNVLTLASRIRPLPVSDIVHALTNIIRIRNSEDALDYALLSALVLDVVLSKHKEDTTSTGIYEPPRGSPERSVILLMEESIVPLITQRSDLWALLSRLRSWRGDHAGSIEASERAWRAAVGSSSGSGLLPGSNAAADWTTDKPAWEEVVKRTDELVSVLENWGPEVDSIGSKWKGKARSAVRSVMGRAKENWEGSEGWSVLEGIMAGLKA